jgi:D-serine dehydratase
VTTIDDRLDWRFKGIPGQGEPIDRRQIAERGWNVLREDLMLPVAVLRQSAIDHNSGWMRRFTELTGVRIAPHGKTTMSPDLFAIQFADGAWGLTAATAGHVRTYRRHGVSRILLANQLVGKANIAYILDEIAADPAFDFYCLVDSIASVELLVRALAGRSPGRPLQLLVELGLAGGRSGVRDDAEALAIARQVAASPGLALRGIEAFEGIVQAGADDETRVHTLLDRMATLAGRCRRDGLFTGIPMLSAGGSAFFDLVASRRSDAMLAGHEIVLRSGCYLIHDSSFYRDLVARLLARSPEAARLGEGLRPALELWTYVQSRPEPTRLIAAIGKRDTSADAAMPTPIAWARPGRDAAPIALDSDHVCVRLDDQHAYLDVPAGSPLAVGDLIAFGIAHPCTTFDRWRALYLVDDALTVTGAVRTFF